MADHRNAHWKPRFIPSEIALKHWTRTLKIVVVYRFAFGIVILLLMFLHRGAAR